MIADDFRKLKLIDWLENDLLLSVDKLEPASSDASFRRYFRATLPDKTLVVMDAPPDKENIAPFIKVAAIMANARVKVPAIYYQNLADGFLALEDFGSTCYLDKLTPANADELYQSALASLLTLQTSGKIDGLDLPRYDEALLRRELAIFAEWFVCQRLDIDLPDGLWQDTNAILIESALVQPLTCVHRDFHSRNLMLLADRTPGIIDFQDAVIGPITYDLVSLLRDCYIAWPEDKVSQWLGGHYQQLVNFGLVDSDLKQFTRWFDLMGVQRHLKAIGIFSRLDIRDGKPGYLKDIPRTLNYVVEQCRKYSELAAFGEFLNQQVLPRFPVQ